MRAGIGLPVSGTKRRKIEAEAAAAKAQSKTILWMVNMEECNRKLRYISSLSFSYLAVQDAPQITGSFCLPFLCT